MLLTISLLCSGREKTTEKCLKSILKIKQGIGDTEIIIIDTGCDDSMRRMISKYADKVIPFTWCNDFSVARNVGVDAAQGQWFMFIDDDEWFEDPSPIIQFFTSGTYQQYTSATYRVRNYENLLGTSYADSVNSRLAKMGDKSINRFHGKIHEYFATLSGATCHIDCHAEHYGYAHSTPEEKLKKSQRNLPLIIDTMNEEPDKIRWPQQLASEYYELKKYNELIELCNTTINKIKDRNDYEANAIRPMFYCAKILSLLFSKNPDNAFKTYTEAISEKDLSPIAYARLLQLGVRSSWGYDKDYDFILESVDSYLKIYAECDKKREELNNPIFLINEAFDATHFDEIIIYGVLSAIHKDNASKALSLYKSIIWTVPNNKVTISADIINIINEISNANYDEKYAEIVNSLLANPLTANLCMERIKNLLLQNQVWQDNQFLSSIITIYTANLSLDGIYNTLAEFEDSFNNDSHLDFLQLKLYESIIEKTPAEQWESFDDLLEAISLWSQVAAGYYSAYIDADTLFISSPEIDSPSQVALKLYLFLQVAGEDFRQAFEIIKMSLGIYPPLDSMLNQLARMYAEFYKTTINEI